MSEKLQSLRVQPSRALQGSVRPPGDKSISHRALLLGSLAEGETRVTGFLAGEDCLATMAALKHAGIGIETKEDGTVSVLGRGLNGFKKPSAPLDLGNSGTGMRLLAGLLAGQAFESRLIGDASLSARPMERIAGPLRAMGAEVSTIDGHPPLTIKGGELAPIDYTSPVASAQVKSAVLLAGLYAQGITSVTEPGVTRDHTERMLRTYGADVQSAHNIARVTGPANLQGVHVEVPADLSSATFPLAAGLLSDGDGVSVMDIGINPTRTGVLDILRLMNARIDIEEQREFGAEPVATIRAHASALRGVQIPAELIPLAIDELPMVFALAAAANGTTVITGAEELRHKESDRITLMVNGLQSLGVDAEERPDGAVITGGRITGGQVDSGGDHRIAMAFCVLAAVAAAPVTVRDTANIATSFPGFVPIMRSIGLPIEAAP